MAVFGPGSLPVNPEAGQWVSSSNDVRTRQATIKEQIRSMWVSRGEDGGEQVANGEVWPDLKRR